MRSIESGTLDMRPTAFDPRDAIRDLLQVCRMGCCTQAGVAWVNEAEPLPRVVEADRSFLFQIVQNLVRAFCALRCNIVWARRMTADVRRSMSR